VLNPVPIPDAMFSTSSGPVCVKLPTLSDSYPKDLGEVSDTIEKFL
jgi:hypothetical protein